MSRKLPDNPADMDEDELRYAHARYLINDEQFDEAMSRINGSGEHVLQNDDGEIKTDNYESMSAKELKEEYDRRIDDGRVIPKPANKTEAAQALRDDDFAQAAEAASNDGSDEGPDDDDPDGDQGSDGD